jgi:FlaA1/EpsC-like NDP-sugar epimerase
MFNWKNEEVLILGGTGTLGRALTRLLHDKAKGIRIFSRGELEQARMKKEFAKYKAPIAYMIGDVKDYERLLLATRGASIVINAAAMKHVDICEENPLEAINTNIVGARNVILAALENQVHRVMHVSTDKAVYPVNLYGATKAVTEKLFVQANVYSGGRWPKFSCCRYGNVLGSRGSVVAMFRKQYAEGQTIKLTDHKMTRFWLTMERAAKFIIASLALDKFKEGVINIPTMRGALVSDIAKAVLLREGVTEYTTIETGLRPGEKLHECILAEEELPYTTINNYAIGGLLVRSPLFTAPLKSPHVTKLITSEKANTYTQQELLQMLEDSNDYID